MSSPAESFADFGLSPGLLQALTDIGYETPSPSQAECIPVLLAGHDLIGQAQTGTGKTWFSSRHPAPKPLHLGVNCL